MPNTDDDKLLLFLGSGFSAELGLPTTQQLRDRLLETPGNDPEVQRREQFISKRIREFWQEVFGWNQGCPTPSLEDHFTQIDLAANSGHHLGHLYSPRKLRAVRRMTIHRVLKLLDVRPAPSPPIDRFFRQLTQRFQITIVTTNWDIITERSLEQQHHPFNYGLDAFDSRGSAIPKQGIPILKLHGSGNWGYCDCCRNLITFDIGMGKVAVNLRLFLEPDDFRLFEGGSEVADDLAGFELRRCNLCGGRWGSRVATFSYRKDLSIPVFQTIWDLARLGLQQANRWLLLGYSMPDGDIEIRHLLKSAQLARMTQSNLSIEVILKNHSAAADRYKRFFGLPDDRIFQHTLGNWIEERLSDYCR